MLRAIRADASVGSASASSNALVCNDCVPPRVAASASTAVRTTLLYGSWLVRLTPEVWQWVRSISERGSVGLNTAPFMVIDTDIRSGGFRRNARGP